MNTNARTLPIFAAIILLDIFAGININVLIWGVFVVFLGAGTRVAVFPLKGFWPNVSGAMAGILLGTAIVYLMRDSDGYWGIARDVLAFLFGLFGPETVTGIKGPYREAIKKRFKKFTDDL